MNMLLKQLTYVYEYVGGTGVTTNYYLEIIFVVSLLVLITVIKLKNN